MRKATNRLNNAVALALLTEMPESRLHLPDAEQTPVERHVATLLRLLALIGEVRWEDDEFVGAQAVATIDDAEVARIDAALAAIDLQRWRRPLDRCAQVLLRGVDGPASSDERVLQIAERVERFIRFVNRQLYLRGDIVADLENALIGYLERKSDSPAWKAASRQESVSATMLAPVATRCDGGDGSLCVVLQIDTDALTEPLQAWITQTRGTELFTRQARRPLSTIAKAFEDSRGRRAFHGMPEDRVIGTLRQSRQPAMPAFDQLGGMQLDAALQDVVDTYAWAIFSWPNTMQESALAFVTRDASLADAWVSVLRQHNRQHELIASYRNVASLQARAGGAQFGECSGYGEAALIAAASDSAPPWLVVSVQQGSLHGWRRQTARLGIGIAAAQDHRYGTDFVGVYRANDTDAYRMLWQRLDHEDGIVQVAACGHNAAKRVLDAYMGADRHDFRTCNALSQRLGWIYTHVHGGGAGEHHAMFHAKDPALTNRVVAYAAKQPGWYLSGRW